MKKILNTLILSIGIIFSINSIAKSDYCVDQNVLCFYNEQNFCNPTEILSWMPKVYKVDLKTWEEMKSIARKISKELGEENADKFFDKLSAAREKIYKDYKSSLTNDQKESLKVSEIENHEKNRIFK